MIKIRPLNAEDDLFAVSKIYERSWKFAYQGMIPADFLNSIPSGQWAGRLGQPDRHSLLLLEGGNPIGTSSYGKARMQEMKDFGEIISIYLLPEAMHKGYGGKLMQAVLAELQKMGYSQIYLWVLEENTNARRFYERWGFVPGGRTQTERFAGKELKEIQYIRHSPSFCK